MINFEQWKRYFSGEMPNDEMHELEKQTLEDEGEGEAYDFYSEEGIEQYKDTIDKINNRIWETTKKKESKVVGLYAVRNWIAVAVIIALSVGGYWIYMVAGKRSNKEVVKKDKPIIKDTLSNVLKKNSIPREQLVITTEEMPSTSTKNTLENDVEKPEMIVANFIKNRKVNDHDELLVTAAIPKWEGSKSVEELTKLPYRMELNIKVEGKVKYSELYVELDNPKCLVKVPVNEWVKIGCAKKVAFITISCADNKTKPFKVMSGKRIIVKVGGVGISG